MSCIWHWPVEYSSSSCGGVELSILQEHVELCEHEESSREMRRDSGARRVPVPQVSSRLTCDYNAAVGWKRKILVWRDVFLPECLLMIDGLCLSISPHSTLSSLSNAYNNINTLNYNKRDFSSYTFSFHLLMFSFAFLKQHELELWIFKTKCTVIFVVLFFLLCCQHVSVTPSWGH